MTTMHRRLRALWRMLRLVQHVGAGVWTVWWRFPKLSQPERDARVKAWALELLGKIAIELVVKGRPPVQGPVLLVANHISWLDIVVLHAVRHCRFISKSDIKHWPIIGMLATAAGTLYIERESRRDAMRVMHHMAEGLRAHDVLAVFPEGTTGTGLTVMPFHANLLQAAITTDAPVQPLGLSFVDGQTGQLSTAPSFTGEDTLLQSLWRTLCADHLQAWVEWGEPQTAQGRDRRAWAQDLHAEVQALRTVAPPTGIELISSA
jgi:1-acyl-sn-glycerol-3-phosphate acyltransferase